MEEDEVDHVGSEWVEQETFSGHNVMAEEFVPGKFAKAIPISEVSDDASSLGSNQSDDIHIHQEEPNNNPLK